MCFYFFLEITLEQWFVVVLWGLGWMCLPTHTFVFCRCLRALSVRSTQSSEYSFMWGQVHGHNLPWKVSFPLLLPEAAPRQSSPQFPAVQGKEGESSSALTLLLWCSACLSGYKLLSEKSSENFCLFMSSMLLRHSYFLKYILSSVFHFCFQQEDCSVS